MSRAYWFLAFAASALSACDDGVLRAFEPRLAALGGVDAGGGADVAGGSTPSPEGGGGTSGTGGVEPSAGAAGLAAASSPPLIDDFEDGDMRAKAPLGWWYPVNDGTGTQGIGIEPLDGATPSVYALRTHGSGFMAWGAAVGVDLAGDPRMPFNALVYERLCFVARVGAGDSGSLQVHLLRDPGVHYIRDVSLSETWTRHCLALGDFVAAGQEPLTPDQLIALQFFFAPAASFELWLDDVELEPY